MAIPIQDGSARTESARPRPRPGRVRIVSDGRFPGTHVEVVPDDGGDAIALPCTRLSWTVEPNGFATVSLETVGAKADFVGTLDDETLDRLAVGIERERDRRGGLSVQLPLDLDVESLELGPDKVLVVRLAEPPTPEVVDELVGRLREHVPASVPIIVCGPDADAFALAPPAFSR